MSEEKKQGQNIETISFNELYARTQTHDECLDVSKHLLKMAVEFGNKAVRLRMASQIQDITPPTGAGG